MSKSPLITLKEPIRRAWPPSISLLEETEGHLSTPFLEEWQALMTNCCHEHPVWHEPFAQALQHPEISKEQCFKMASVWAINMVVGSYCFPRYVAALAARAEQDAVRHGLLENAWDESGGYGHTTRSHFWLAVRLARLLGLSDREIERIRPLPEAQMYTDEHYDQCTSGDFGFALGMICLIEEFTTPEFTMIFKALQRSSKTGLDISSEDFIVNGGAEYFIANIADDERHRQEMPRLVIAWLRANGVDLNNRVQVCEGLEIVQAGARRSADLRQAFFAGIHQFVRAGGTFRDLV